MSDISFSFPPWMIAWFLLGEATPFITVVLIGTVAAFFVGRSTRIRRARWLKWALAIVGGFWFGGISFWAACLVDQIKTDIYQTRHHYRLDKSAVMAGIEVRGAAGSRLTTRGTPTQSRLQSALRCRSTARCGGRHPSHLRAQPQDHRSWDDQERDARRGTPRFKECLVEPEHPDDICSLRALLPLTLSGHPAGEA